LYQPEAGKDIQVRLLQLLDRICACPKILENPLSRGMIVDDILEIVVTVMGADTQSWGRPPPSTTRAYIVYKAQQFIEERLATGFSMSELCTTLRVSRRTLEYAFRDIIGASPKRYILALRLGRARRDIVVRGAQISITEIAERWGFFHPGRFGAVYKDFFHERPSETVGVNLGR
jgi:AraC family transcriptional regulator, ethanolamine operon transcriptional activator